MRGAIWYKDEERMKIMVSDLIERYNKIGVKCTRIGSFIDFDNGDNWKVINIIDKPRAYRANVTYIQKDIENEKVHSIIMPTVNCIPYGAYNYY